MAYSYHDEGTTVEPKTKLQWSLLPWEPLAAIVRVFRSGITDERPKDNWKKAKTPQDFLDAAMRHMASLMAGELFDKKSREHHAAHVAANMLIYIWHTTRLEVKPQESVIITTGDLEGREGQ